VLKILDTVKKELRSDVKRRGNKQIKRETGRNITIAVLDIKRYCLSLDVYKKMFAAPRTGVPIVKFVRTLLKK